MIALTILGVIYASGAFVIFAVGALNFTMPVGDDYRRGGARAILIAPIWPIYVALHLPQWMRMVWEAAQPKKPTPGPSETDEWTERYR